MRRTTIYLEPDLETRVKAEARRRGVPMAVVIREALREKLERESPDTRHRNAGAFSSGRGDTSEHFDAILEETGFGQ